MNKYLIQGPLLTKDLTGVPLRFRQEPIAVTCDIKGMFHQVRVNPEQRDFLLSTVSSVYGLMGFVAPLMLQGKAILQELCGLNLEWDEPVPEEAKMKWER